MKHYKIVFSGKVQDVWFRKFTETQAFDLGLKGFSMNRNDGTVYVELEGDEAILKEFVSRCKAGPEKAQVDNVEISEHQLVHFAKFEVRY
ncbi:MAG: acylphosphatase [Flavobacteriales bacterium]|nr:acylphosphatase [Flavobacteriales bacterium]